MAPVLRGQTSAWSSCLWIHSLLTMHPINFRFYNTMSFCVTWFSVVVFQSHWFYPKSLQKAWSSGAPNLFRRCPRELLSTSPRFSHGTWVLVRQSRDHSPPSSNVVYICWCTYIYIYMFFSIVKYISLSSEYKYIRCIMMYNVTLYTV